MSMSQPVFAPVIYRLIPAGAATFGTVGELDKNLHEIWDGMQFVPISDIVDEVADVAINQYVANNGAVYIGTATQKVLSRESKTTISAGMLADLGYLPSEVVADPIKVSYQKSTGVIVGSMSYGDMPAKKITVSSAARVYWTGGFIVDDE
jgi:hypothetical protein